MFVGCKSSDNNNFTQNPKEKIEALEESGKLPKLDRSSDIAGPDANGNGVRDDIEEYIVKNYSNEKERKALFQFAKTFRESLLIDVSNMIAVKAADIKQGRAFHCIFLVFDANQGTENPSTAWQKIESMSTNTKPRLKAYLAYNHALDGTTWSLPQGDTCE